MIFAFSFQEKYMGLVILYWLYLIFGYLKKIKHVKTWSNADVWRLLPPQAVQTSISLVNFIKLDGDYVDSMNTCLLFYEENNWKAALLIWISYPVEYRHLFLWQSKNFYNALETVTKFTNANCTTNQVTPLLGVYYFLHIFPNL